MNERCPPTGCPDDVCRATRECLLGGHPLAERCGVCGEVFYEELDGCRCDREEAYYDEPEDWPA